MISNAFALVTYSSYHIHPGDVHSEWSTTSTVPCDVNIKDFNWLFFQITFPLFHKCYFLMVTVCVKYVDSLRFIWHHCIEGCHITAPKGHCSEKAKLNPECTNQVCREQSCWVLFSMLHEYETLSICASAENKNNSQHWRQMSFISTLTVSNKCGLTSSAANFNTAVNGVLSGTLSL